MLNKPLLVKSKTTLLYKFSGQECSLTIKPQQIWIAKIKHDIVTLTYGDIKINLSVEKFNKDWEEY